MNKNFKKTSKFTLIGGTTTTKRIFYDKNQVDVDTGKKGCWIFSKEIEKANEGVENGVTKLVNEANHVILANLPNSRLKNLYAHCYGIADKGSKLVAYFKFYWEGLTMGDLLRSPKVDLEVYQNSELLLFKALFSKFYSNIYQKIKADYWEKMYFERVARRLKAIDDLMKRDHTLKKRFAVLKKAISNGCIINNKKFAPICDYLKILRNNTRLLSEVTPVWAQETHQDLNLNDVVVEFVKGGKSITNFRLIDPRGVGEVPLAYRHFYYDGGEWLFVLDGLDIYRLYNKPALGKWGECLIFEYKDKNKPEFLFEPNEEHLVAKRYKQARENFIEMLKTLPEFQWFKSQHPSWLKALLLSEACMYIPDVPCRMISDSYSDETIAISTYLRGIQLLDEFVTRYC